MCTSFEKVLPVEIWQEILAEIPAADLCNVMMTSRHMNSVASWPDLWMGIKVNINNFREKGLAEFYSINRFTKITKLDFSNIKLNTKDLEKLFNDIIESPLENIDLSGVNLRGIPSELLGRSLGQLRTVNLDNTHLLPDLPWCSGTTLTTHQSTKILESSLTYKTLVNLNLMHVNLSEVPADLLARAVCRLRTANLRQTRLTTDQCVKLLETSGSCNTLVNVELTGIDLRGVPGQILARAVSQLHTVNLWSTYLTTEQCVKIAEAIISSCTLVSLDLSDIHLRGISPKLLAEAVARLETIKMNCTRLTTDQCVEILESTSKSTTLKNLDLTGVSLSEVPDELLARTVLRLQTIKLRNTDLTTEQCVKVMEVVISSTTLVSIDLKGVNLCEVPPELLSKAISNLKTVNLFDTKLTTNHCVKVLEACLTSNTLASVNLRAVNLNEVPAELLARAVKHLRTFNLCETNLTSDQCVKVLAASHSSTTLNYLDLRGNQIKLKVPSELFASIPSNVNVRQPYHPFLM